MMTCLVPLKATVKSKITEVSVQCFQLSEVFVCKATEVQLLTWLRGRRVEKRASPLLHLGSCER